MNRTVIERFHHDEEAQKAVRELVSNGFSKESISLESPRDLGKKQQFGSEGENPIALAAGIAAVYGTVVGGLVGMVAGHGYLGTVEAGLIPPAGTLVSMLFMPLAGAGLGALAFALIGVLFGLGINALQYFMHNEHPASTIVAVRAEGDQAARATQILRQHSNPLRH